MQKSTVQQYGEDTPLSMQILWSTTSYGRPQQGELSIDVEITDRDGQAVMPLATYTVGQEQIGNTGLGPSGPLSLMADPQMETDDNEEELEKALQADESGNEPPLDEVDTQPDHLMHRVEALEDREEQRLDAIRRKFGADFENDGDDFREFVPLRKGYRTSSRSSYSRGRSGYRSSRGYSSSYRSRSRSGYGRSRSYTRSKVKSKYYKSKYYKKSKYKSKWFKSKYKYKNKYHRRYYYYGGMRYMYDDDYYYRSRYPRYQTYRREMMWGYSDYSMAQLFISQYWTSRIGYFGMNKCTQGCSQPVIWKGYTSYSQLAGNQPLQIIPAQMNPDSRCRTTGCTISMPTPMARESVITNVFFVGEVEWPVQIKVHRAELRYNAMGPAPFVMLSFVPAEMEPITDAATALQGGIAAITVALTAIAVTAVAL